MDLKAINCLKGRLVTDQKLSLIFANKNEEELTSIFQGRLRCSIVVFVMKWFISGLFLALLSLSSKLHAEKWECSVTEGWSGNLKMVVLYRDRSSFKTKSVSPEQYQIIYESNREIHLYRNEFGSVMTAITLFKETSEILELTFYPPSHGRERFGSGGKCIVRKEY